jgi:hypothetical protein
MVDQGGVSTKDNEQASIRTGARTAGIQSLLCIPSPQMEFIQFRMDFILIANSSDH